MPTKPLARPLVVAIPLVLAVLAACGADPGTGASSPSSSSSGGGSSSGSSGGGSSGSSGQGSSGGAEHYGDKYEGGEFHLGPVDYDETQWHNACAPGTKYAAEVRKSEGNLLAGLWGGLPDVATYCDACIAVTTAKGKSAVLRVVTYGDTTKNSIDVSPEAYALLDSGEYPRAMTWQFTDCPTSGPLLLEFQTGSSEWWTSLWVRNPRLPIVKAEVKSANHPSFVALARGGDGTLTDGSGFGKGSFTVRLTSMNGKSYEETFEWPSAGVAGQTLRARGNFE